jgi:hypothetical protein
VRLDWRGPRIDARCPCRQEAARPGAPRSVRGEGHGALGAADSHSRREVIPSAASLFPTETRLRREQPLRKKRSPKAKRAELPPRTRASTPRRRRSPRRPDRSRRSRPRAGGVWRCSRAPPPRKRLLVGVSRCARTRRA